MTAYFNANDGGLTYQAAGWTDFTGLTAIGGTATSDGITVTVVAPWSTYNTPGVTGDHHGLPNPGWKSRYYQSVGTAAQLRYSALTPGASYDFDYYCLAAASARDTTIFDGTTTVTYDDNGSLSAPAAPIRLQSVADGSGEILHTLNGVSVLHYFTAVSVAPAVVAVAPVISSPTTIATVGGTTATTGVTTDTATGTLYTITTVNSGVPSGAQIKAGTNASGFAATFSGNQVVSSTGAKTFSNTGLTASTTYYSHSVHENSAGFSNVTTQSFTTRTTTHIIPVPAAANVGGAGVDSKSVLANQGWLAADEPVYTNSPDLPVDWTWIAPTTGWSDAPLEQDVNDYLLPPVGFTGSEIITFGRQYADATLVPWDATLTVSGGVISVGGLSFAMVLAGARSIVDNMVEAMVQ